MLFFSCKIAPSAAQAMVSVFCDLRAQRSAVGVFLASDGLMTLRDLFRWGQRLAGSNQNDWRQCLAEHGEFFFQFHVLRCNESYQLYFSLCMYQCFLWKYLLLYLFASFLKQSFTTYYRSISNFRFFIARCTVS